MIVETPRLRLRPWRENDRDGFAAMRADPQVIVDAQKPLSRDKSDRKLDRYAAAFDRLGFCSWAVEGPDGAFIGYAGVMPSRDGHPLGPHHGAGWRLVRRAWGHGYATEAARFAFEDVFERVGLPEVLAYTSPENARSLAVMARLGLPARAGRDFTAEEGARSWTGLVWSARPG
ncbi:MAG TPA: GNAT family N-acetyltransferase [Caulobacteraceae bacterium]|nr:GNAT family N-acetyltransferase [Caulobacteraceae bacterium]